MSKLREVYSVGYEGDVKYEGVRSTSEEVRFVPKRNDNQRKASRNYFELAELGGFIIVYHNLTNLLFQETGVERANISRLIYLSTYLDYNNSQENLLVVRGHHNSKKAMTKGEMKLLLKLSDKTFKRFLKDVKEHGMLFETNDKYYLAPQFFTKGRPNKEYGDYAKVYIDTTRQLYENCKVTQHVKLSYIYQLMPYLSYETNVLCANPQESDTSKLKKLSLKQICEILNLSTDRSNISKFRREISSFRVKIDGREHLVFNHVTIGEKRPDFSGNNYFALNPRVIWKGSDMTINRKSLEFFIFYMD